MKITIIILILSHNLILMAKTACLDPYKDVRLKVDSLKSDEFIIKKSDFNFDKKSDVLIINKLSCGLQGCENYIYTQQSKNCYTYSGSFFGQLNLDKLKLLTLKKQGGLVSHLVFDKKTKTFKEAKL